MSKTITKNSASKENVWLSSLHEFKNLRVVVFCGMMAACAVVLSLVATIRIGSFIKIGFSGIPNRVVDYLFGPAAGAIFGAALDVIKWFITPDGDFFPGFTISAMLGGLVYGFILYKKKLTIQRMFVAQLIVKVVVNIGLNSLWLKILYDQAIIALLPSRILSNAVMLPIDTFIYYIVLLAVDKSIKRYFME
ncbi:MAG: folate family ECF transporter S component [Butyrivibrio sp.]|nr:folate family ECF transporter S component [Butyrivibrio sp.]